MNFKIKDLIDLLNKEYLFDLQEDWDNSGFQIGNLEDDIVKILLCMDISVNSINYAIENKINCIVTHHPLFFEKIKNLEYSSAIYKKLEMIIKNKINVITVHTPLDFHCNGINKYLADKCFLYNQEVFINYKNKFGYGIIGNIKNKKFYDYIKELKNIFKNPILCFGNYDKLIYKVAVLGGSGAFSIKEAILKDVDLLISSDFKYHDIQFALENNLNLIDLGHYESEVFGLLSLQKFLSENLNLDIYFYDDNIFKRNVF